MANLRGGTFDKQIRDAFFRLEAFGEKRHFNQDNLTHSIALAEKRKMYLQDFKEYLQERGITEGKINQYMSQETIKDFIAYRTMELSPKSALDYTAGFNSLLKGLEQANIIIPANPSNTDFLKDFREAFRSELRELKIEKGRYIFDLDKKLDELKERRFESYTIAKLQAQTGLRVAEAMEVAKNFEKYYNPQTGMLEGITGKGNHIYDPKPISYQLANEIQKMQTIPHYNTYRADLKQVGIEKSHDFRVTYAKNLMDHKLKEGKEYRIALVEVSQEINHHRPSMTEYYLQRA